MAREFSAYPALLSSIFKGPTAIPALAQQADKLKRLADASTDQSAQLVRVPRLAALLGQAVALGLQQLPPVLQDLPNNATNQQACNAIGALCFTLAQFCGKLGKQAFAAVVQTEGETPQRIWFLHCCAKL
jgi:hypothetical protein